MINKIQIVKADITKLEVDAVVNAANSTLLGGGGVDGAIHRTAGPGLYDECRKLGGCDPGNSKITRGYKLPAKYVIHTVGPVWYGGYAGEADLLASCYRTILQLAGENHIRTIAFPAISCGIYGYPVEKGCRIALKETIDFLKGNPFIEKVVFACFSEDDYEAYKEAFMEISNSL